jgi:Flp pilus assembly protein TadG
MRKHYSRKTTGSSIAEAGAALGLLLPLAFTLMFAVFEGSYAYLIKDSLSQASRQAARDLSIAYGQNGGAIANSRTLQNTLVFDRIRIRNMIASSQQFDNPVWQTALEPYSVTVTCRYTGGSYGLPTFPNPDPLRLGRNITLTSTSTYRLE